MKDKHRFAAAMLTPSQHDEAFDQAGGGSAAGD